MRRHPVFKIVNNRRCPTQLQSNMNFGSPNLCGRSLSDTRGIHLSKVTSATGQSTVKFAAGKEWNNLPKELRAKDLNLRTFEYKIFKFLLG